MNEIIKIKIRKKKIAEAAACFLAAVFPVLLGVCLVFSGSSGQDGTDEREGHREKAEEMVVEPPVSSAAETAAGMRETKSLLWFGEDDEPVDFLEEKLPETSPDPDRPHGNVIEIDGSGNKNIGGLFSVNDSTETGLDLMEEFKKEVKIPVKKGEPSVLIYHTHTCESFLSNYSGFYYKDQNFRSTEKNITDVGEKLKEALEAEGYTVIHDTAFYDAPVFNGAYGRSMDSVKDWLEKYPSIQVTIDMHRDSLGEAEGDRYKPTVKIDGRKAAQMMIIAGCDPTGELEYENWYENLLFALKIQAKGEEMYPGLMRPLMFCRRSYNMEATDTSFLVEVGTEVNTLAEAEYSGHMLGKILAEVLDDLKE